MNLDTEEKVLLDLVFGYAAQGADDTEDEYISGKRPRITRLWNKLKGNEKPYEFTDLMADNDPCDHKTSELYVEHLEKESLKEFKQELSSEERTVAIDQYKFVHDYVDGNFEYE